MASASPTFVGLTGGVASGKSEALAAFARHGAATLSADAVVHELLGDESVRDRLVQRWGGEALAGGEVDRARVGAIVFERPEELEWLESVLHPLVGERVAAWAGELGDAVALAVVEVPLLFEAGLEDVFDVTVAVVAADERRAQRAGDRGVAHFERRGERQLSQEEKAARATHVLRNDGTLADLDRQVKRLADALAGRKGGGG